MRISMSYSSQRPHDLVKPERMNLSGNFLIKTLYRHNVRIDMRMKSASNALTSLGPEEWLRV